ncbi:MAG: S41 family peptidase, partial [Thermoplasma acidophilum]|nr:S41 family peptidase [Thermoplasma acidophilum]
LPHWKEYKGGTRGKIWSGTIEKGFKKIIDLKNHISCPVIVKDRIYFITDIDGAGNIYSTDLDGNDLKKHTDFHEYYPRHLNTDGKNIVFYMGGDIYTFDPINDNVKSLDIGSVFDTDLKQSYAPSKFLEDFSMSPGDMYSIVSRGKAFIFNENVNYSIPVKSDGRVRYLRFLSKNEIALVVGDKDGDSIGIFDAGTGEMKRKIGPLGNIFSVKSSEDGKYLVVGNDNFQILLIDVSDGTIKEIDQSREGLIVDFAISKDSRFIAYSFPVKSSDLASYVQRHIKLFDTLNDKHYDVTTETANDFAPAFDADTNYLYYLSNRSLDPSTDRFTFNFGYLNITRPFVVPLKKGYVSPARNMPQDIEPEKGEYDLERLKYVSEPLPVDQADYRSITPLKDGVLLFSVPIHGEFSSYYSGQPEKGIIVKFEFKDKKVKEIKKEVVDFKISTDGSKIMFSKQDGKLYTFRMEKPEEEKSLNIDAITIVSNVKEDFAEMYDEAWKLARDNYWDKEHALTVSEKIYERYRKLVERCVTRWDLSYLITEMQGEYRTSHSYEMGGYFTDIDMPRAGRIACDFKYSNGEYVISDILYGDPSNENEKSPFLLSTLDADIGDAVIEIDGISIGKGKSIYEALVGKGNRSAFVKIRKKDNSVRSGFVDVLQDDRYIRYRAWVEKNKKFVHERTNGKIGYIHIPDMGIMGLNEFYRQYVTEASRNGLIVDVRFNGGGFVSQLILEKLYMKRLGYDNPRRGTLEPYPMNSIEGPMIAITNEYAGSDGDIFSYSFKALHLGTLIGTRTWGGVVGISPRRKLIDGTVLSQPEYAFWFKGSGFSVENYGVDPDVVIEYPPEMYNANVDPQLERAIEMVLADLEKYKIELPKK